MKERRSPAANALVSSSPLTAGRPAADGAIIVGRSIANRDGEVQELVAVEALERLREWPGATIVQTDLPLRLAQQRARTTNVGRDSWPLSIAYGSPTEDAHPLHERGNDDPPHAPSRDAHDRHRQGRVGAARAVEVRHAQHRTGRAVGRHHQLQQSRTWAFHCHILPHAESEHGMFGMVTALVVQP